MKYISFGPVVGSSIKSGKEKKKRKYTLFLSYEFRTYKRGWEYRQWRLVVEEWENACVFTAILVNIPIWFKARNYSQVAINFEESDAALILNRCKETGIRYKPCEEKNTYLVSGRGSDLYMLGELVGQCKGINKCTKAVKDFKTETGEDQVIYKPNLLAD